MAALHSSSALVWCSSVQPVLTARKMQNNTAVKRFWELLGLNSGFGGVTFSDEHDFEPDQSWRSGKDAHIVLLGLL